MENDFNEKKHQQKTISRRDALKSGVGLTAIGSLFPFSGKALALAYIRETIKNGKVVVVGAGAFGGWTALIYSGRGIRLH